MHRRVDERLHDEEDIGWACAADGGGHGHELLVVDLKLLAERPEQDSRLVALRIRHFRSAVPDRHALTELRRSVWHTTHDLTVIERIAQGLGRGAGDDADEQLAVAQRPAQLASDTDEHLRL